MTKAQAPRRRCHTCRKYFGFLVIEGLYCSWKCQGWSDEEIEESWRRVRLGWARIQQRRSARNIPEGMEVPRECRTWYWKYKDRLSEHSARQRAADLSCDFYQCGNCQHWHVGNKHEQEEEDHEGDLAGGRDGQAGTAGAVP